MHCKKMNSSVIIKVSLQYKRHLSSHICYIRLPTAVMLDGDAKEYSALGQPINLYIVAWRRDSGRYRSLYALAYTV
jgi:hypothetical protein